MTIPLAPRTARAIDLAIGERVEGPIFLDTHGERLDGHAASRIVRRLAGRAGINKPVEPHTLRHVFITAALDAGVPLRDVQEAASHADPRTTLRYDRARVSLDRRTTYIVAVFIAGAAQVAHCDQRADIRTAGRRCSALSPRSAERRTVVRSGTRSDTASGMLAIASAIRRQSETPGGAMTGCMRGPSVPPVVFRQRSRRLRVSIAW